MATAANTESALSKKERLEKEESAAALLNKYIVAQQERERTLFASLNLPTTKQPEPSNKDGIPQPAQPTFAGRDDNAGLGSKASSSGTGLEATQDVGLERLRRRWFGDGKKNANRPLNGPRAGQQTRGSNTPLSFGDRKNKPENVPKRNPPADEEEDDDDVGRSSMITSKKQRTSKIQASRPAPTSDSDAEPSQRPKKRNASYLDELLAQRTHKKKSKRTS